MASETASNATATATANDARDIAAFDAMDRPARAFPDTVQAAGSRASFDIVVRQSVLNDIHAHGNSARDVEVCGVLVGNVYRDSSNGPGAAPFLYIESIVRGNYASGQAAQVTFTAETWNHIHATMERDHPDRCILGWYHTHPGYGIFLSDMDEFIHDNFFGVAWQVAFVYDPKGGDEGLFVWQRGKLARRGFLLEPDVPSTQPRRTPASKAAAKSQKAPAAPGVSNAGGALERDAHEAPGTMSEFADRIRAMEQRQRWMIVALALVALAALVWPLVLSLAMTSSSRTETPAPRTVMSTAQPGGH